MPAVLAMEYSLVQSFSNEQLPEASEEEENMLDMAPGLTETSRLCCEVQVEEYMDGMTITMPKATRNLYVDGHVPKPH